MAEWRDVVGYEGLYRVSDEGEVWSVKLGRLLRQHLNHGYSSLGLADREGKRKTVRVHRLVAEAFIPNPDNLPLVRHWDDVRTNNVVENLSWGTHSDNRIDSVRNGTHARAAQTHCERGHEFTPENTYIRPGRPGRECRKCKAILRNEWRKKRRTLGLPV